MPRAWSSSRRAVRRGGASPVRVSAFLFLVNVDFWLHLLVTVSDSADVPLRDPVHPYATGLVCPPVASVVAKAERDRDLCDRDPRPPAVLQPSPQTTTWVILLAGGWKFRSFV